MSKQEVKDILRVIICCYPSFKPDNMSETVETWSRMLKDVSFEEADEQLQRYIKGNNNYPPNVSHLIPKQNEVYGFKGRVYSHEWFEALEREIESRMPF